MAHKIKIIYDKQPKSGGKYDKLDWDNPTKAKIKIGDELYSRIEAMRFANIILEKIKEADAKVSFSNTTMASTEEDNF